MTSQKKNMHESRKPLKSFAAKGLLRWGNKGRFGLGECADLFTKFDAVMIGGNTWKFQKNKKKKKKRNEKPETNETQYRVKRLKVKWGS